MLLEPANSKVLGPYRCLFQHRKMKAPKRVERQEDQEAPSLFAQLFHRFFPQMNQSSSLPRHSRPTELPKGVRSHEVTPDKLDHEAQRLFFRFLLRGILHGGHAEMEPA